MRGDLRVYHCWYCITQLTSVHISRRKYVFIGLVDTHDVERTVCRTFIFPLSSVSCFHRANCSSTSKYKIPYVLVTSNKLCLLRDPMDLSFVALYLTVFCNSLRLIYLKRFNNFFFGWRHYRYRQLSRRSCTKDKDLSWIQWRESFGRIDAFDVPVNEIASYDDVHRQFLP